MEQIERLINKTLKFFFIHNQGQNNNDEHYYKRNSGKLLNINKNNFFDSFKDNNEEYELKSIPSEENDEESEENDEEKTDKSFKSDSNIKTIIKEEENEGEEEEKEEKKNSFNNNTSNKSKFDSVYYSSSEINSNISNHINNGLERKNSLLSSPKLLDTVRTTIKNELIDYITEKNEKESLISSTFPYSLDEINNESFPFEDSISIHKNENLSSDLLPKGLMKNIDNKYNKIKFNKNFDGFKNLNNNSDYIYYYINNQSNLNKINNSNDSIIIKKSSFDFLIIQKIENFTLIGNINKLNLENIKIVKNNKSLKSELTNNSQKIITIKRSTESLDKITYQNYNNKNLLNKDLFDKNQNVNRISYKSTFNHKLKNKNNEEIKDISFKTLKVKNFKHKSIQESNSLFLSENKNENSPKKNKLNLIKQNIRTNSFILKKPKEFYSQFFYSVINKEDFKNKNDVSFRLQNISKMIESKRDSYVSNLSNVSNVSNVSINDNENNNFNNSVNESNRNNINDIQNEDNINKNGIYNYEENSTKKLNYNDMT